MYNRYVPGHDGSYRRHTVAEPEKCQKDEILPQPVCKEEPGPAECQQPRPRAAQGTDVGDLLLLCIVALLLMDCEEEDSLPLLIIAAVFLLSQ